MLFLSTRNGQMNAFTRDFDSGDVNELTNFKRPVFGAKWSPKNNYIVFGYNDSQNLQNLDIWIMDVDGSNQRKLLSLKDGSQDGVYFHLILHPTLGLCRGSIGSPASRLSISTQIFPGDRDTVSGARIVQLSPVDEF